MESIIIYAKYYDSAVFQPTHYHDSHQMIFVTDGSAVFLIGDTEYSVSEGSLLLISRLENHSIISHSKSYRRYAIGISPTLALHKERQYPIYSVLHNRPDTFRHVVETSRFSCNTEEIFARILDETQTNRPLADEKLDILLHEIMIELFRNAPTLFSVLEPSKNEMIHAIQTRFESDYKTAHTLRSLASEYHVSVYYLSHRFKEITGYSVMENLLFCRLAAAKNLLTTTDLSIGEIVDSCGFSDNSNFSCKFREETGMSPSKFRKQFRHE